MLRGDLEMLETRERDLTKRERKVERDHERLKHCEKDFEGQIQQFNLEKEKLSANMQLVENERAELEKTMTHGTRIDFHRLAKRVNSQSSKLLEESRNDQKEETRVKQSQFTSQL